MQDACTEGQTNSLLSNQLAANQCNVTVIITDLEISPPNDKTGTHCHFGGILSPESSYSIFFDNVCTWTVWIHSCPFCPLLQSLGKDFVSCCNHWERILSPAAIIGKGFCPLLQSLGKEEGKATAALYYSPPLPLLLSDT